ncbi:MAG: ATP-dependent helicase [Candidatus Thermoplasmatota archaeon]
MASATKATEKVLRLMGPEVEGWFRARFAEMTPAQIRAIPLVHRGRSVLISAPTGSGKTLTAFLTILNELIEMEKEGTLQNEVYCVYVSPLKALANDIEKNLLRPLAEISERCGRKLDLRVSVRSGDTAQAERQRMLRKPPHILITTPETLAIVLSAPRFSELLRGARWAIVDEIHELCSSKRGTSLALSLERLEELCARPLVRIGLSATQAPIEEIARFLGGYTGDMPREVRIVEDRGLKGLDIKVLTPSGRMHELPYEVVQAAMYERLAEMIQNHRTTLVFTNTRSGTERVSLRLKEREIESLAAHHGSLSKSTRLDVEESLRNGMLRAVVSSTSLELGIDIGYIDLVCQIGSPKAIAKGLQRIGRSGHGVGRVSCGRIFAFDNDDLIECMVLAKNALEGKIDRVTIPENCLDVLAQTLVGMSIERRWNAADALALVRRAHPYHALPGEDFYAVLRYLGGGWSEGIYPKLWYDEDAEEIGRKKGARMIYYLNTGTIAEEAEFKVLSDKGRSLGKLSEKFVERLSPGDIFVLGARAHEFLRARGMKVYVKDATGRRPTVPSWTGEMLPRSFDLSWEVGGFRRELQCVLEKEGTEGARQWLVSTFPIDAEGAVSTAAFAQLQMRIGGWLPSELAPGIEGYMDEKGRHHAIFHFCYGRRTNDALARALAARLSRQIGANVGLAVTDDGFVLTSSQRFALEVLPRLLSPEGFEGDLTSAVMGTELYKQRFRHCASRSLLVLRNYKGREISLSKQQLRSQRIMEALVSDPMFPVVKETLREIFHDLMDLPHALEILHGIEEGRIRVRTFASEEIPSPFAHGIFLSGLSDIVMMEDRTALLREMHTKVLKRILGDGMEPLFEPEIVTGYFDTKHPRVRAPQDILELLRVVGPLRLFTSKGRHMYRWSDVPRSTLNEWCRALIAEGKIVSVRGKEILWALPEDAAVLAALFPAQAPLTNDEEIALSHLKIRGRAGLQEIAALLGNAIAKGVLQALERRHLATRGDAQGTAWKPLDLPAVRREDAMREMALRILGAAGPMTAEEIALELGASAAQANNLLELLEEEGLLASGAFTYLETQYMLRADLDRLRGKGRTEDAAPEQIHRLLIAKHFTGIEDIEGYFQRFPDAGSINDVYVRAGRFDLARWAEMRRAEEIVSGRFVGGRVRYVHRRDAELMYAAADHPALSQMEREVIELIERNPGAGLEEIVRHSGMPKEDARTALDALDREMLIARGYHHGEGWGGRNRYVRFLPIHEAPKDARLAAVERLAAAHGPMTARALERLSRLDRIELEGLLSALERSGRLCSVRAAGEWYHLSPEDARALGTYPSDHALRLLTLSDPFVLHFMDEVMARYGEGWYYPVFRGAHPVGLVEMWEMSGRVEVRNIELDRPEEINPLLERLERLLPLYSQYGMDTLCINLSLPEEVSHLLVSRGYRRVQGYLALGIDTERTLSLEELLSYTLRRQGVIGEMLASPSAVEHAMLGLRSEMELALRLGTPVPSLKGAHGLYRAFGIPSLLLWCSMQTAMHYRDALYIPPTYEEERLLRAMRAAGGMRRREVIEGSVGVGKDVLERLLRRCAVVRSSSGRYLTVQGAIEDRAEARKGFVWHLLQRFGIVSPELVSHYTRGAIGAPEARRHLQALRSEGRACKGFLVDGDSIPYWIHPEDAEKPIRRMKGMVLITPEDRLGQYLLPWLWKIHGLGGYPYLLISDGRLAAAFKARQHHGGLHIQKYWGEEDALAQARKLVHEKGMKLVRGTIHEGPSDEEIQRWARKLMLSRDRSK